MQVDKQLGAAASGYINIFFEKVINPLIILFIVITFLVFFWFIVKQLAGKMDFGWTEKSTGVFWGIIGLTIVLTAIAITWFVGNTGNTFFRSNSATDGLGQIKYIKINGQ
jgi:hypothetical protein